MGVIVDEPKPIATETWINSRWRPAMAWQCFTVSIFDFIVFPGAVQVHNLKTGSFHEWHSLTLQGGGLYWLAMGGIIGIAVWQRTEEKKAIYEAFSGGSTTISSSSTTVEKTRVDSAQPATPVPEAPSSRKD